MHNTITFFSFLRFCQSATAGLNRVTSARMTIVTCWCPVSFVPARGPRLGSRDMWTPFRSSKKSMGINSAAASARTRLGAHRSGKPTERRLQRVITSSQTLPRVTSIEGIVSWFQRNLILHTSRASVVTDFAYLWTVHCLLDSLKCSIFHFENHLCEGKWHYYNCYVHVVTLTGTELLKLTGGVHVYFFIEKVDIVWFLFSPPPPPPPLFSIL